MSPPPTRVLSYHAVAPVPGDPAERPEMGMVTPPEVLLAHIEMLRDYGYAFATAGQLAERWRGPEPPPGIAVLTFDDGWRDGLTTVTPMLKRLGIQATFYVCPEGFGSRHPQLGDAGVVVTELEAQALHAAGMELGSHTLSHRGVLELSDRDLRHEFREARRLIEALTGERCLTLAYPSGRHDPRVRRAAEDAGYRVAFACRHGPWERYAAPRVQPPTNADLEPVLRRLKLAPHAPALLSTRGDQRSSGASASQLRS
jgi:peptidoglycan/xylan/chitin deacetylase (PgdA/CDA1 family)